jgi:hypothetical protein
VGRELVKVEKIIISNHKYRIFSLILWWYPVTGILQAYNTILIFRVLEYNFTLL